MHLATHYAPGSFLKPCLIVDTVFNSATRETALMFVSALNTDHAAAIVYRGESSGAERRGEWIVMAYHETKQDAIDFHLSLTQHFHNGGTQDEWDEGWEPYLGLWERYCPGAADQIERGAHEPRS